MDVVRFIPELGEFVPQNSITWEFMRYRPCKSTPATIVSLQWFPCTATNKPLIKLQEYREWGA
jgi:hypothetical protein